jgi:hypothetical protein
MVKLVGGTATAALALLALAACGGDKAREASRSLARRNSCVAAELALNAKERLASLDTAVARATGTPMQQVTEASWQFAATYKAWADAASHSADLADSAAWAGNRADSTRWAGEALASRPTAAPNDRLAANAAATFNQDVTRALGNPDHPCNQAAERR